MKDLYEQLRRAVFLDKDGTLIPDIPYNVNPDLITLENETIEGLRILKNEGFMLVVVSNQSGVAKGYFEEEALNGVWNKISALLQQHHLTIDAFYYCPHYPQGEKKEYATECDCRKPLPGLILQAAKELKIDLAQSWMIGDILNDVEAGNKAGCSTVLIDNGNETEWLVNPERTPVFTAKNILEAAAFIKLQVAKLIEHEE